MTDEELTDALDGLFAYDTGSHDSGIYDELLRLRVIEELKTDRSTHCFCGPRLSRIAREMFLTDQAFEKGYNLGDVAEFIEWLKDRMTL